VAGTGLGLYIAREFCLANRCQLAYDEVTLPDGTLRHGFAVRFSAAGAERPGSGFLDTIAPR